MKLLDKMCRIFQGYLFILKKKFRMNFESQHRNFDDLLLNYKYSELQIKIQGDII